jgi:hypothetical protein
MNRYTKNWTLAAALAGVFAMAGCTTHDAGRTHPVTGEVAAQDIRIVADTLPEIVVTASRLAPIPDAEIVVTASRLTPIPDAEIVVTASRLTPIPDAEIVVTAHRLPAALQDVPEIVVVASRLPAEAGPMTASVGTESGAGALLQ